MPALTSEPQAYGKIVEYMNEQAGVLISQISSPSTQIVLQSSMDVDPSCHGVPGKYYLKLIVGPPVRAANFAVTILPQLLTNCTR